MKTTTTISLSASAVITTGATTINVTGPSVVSISVSESEPFLLPDVNTFQGPGGVDQLDVGLMEPGLYIFDHSLQGVKFVKLVAGVPAVIAEGVFLALVNSNPAAPKYWEVR